MLQSNVLLLNKIRKCIRIDNVYCVIFTLEYDEDYFTEKCPPFTDEEDDEAYYALQVISNDPDIAIEKYDKLIEEEFPTNKVMIGTGACSLTDAVELSKFSLEAGIKDCLVLPPFYYKNPSDDGLFSYFSEIIQRLGSGELRIQIYHLS